MSYDAKCYELADAFLNDYYNNDDKAELAQVIQDAIEDYLAGRDGGE